MPEHLLEEKGQGDDAGAAIQPAGDPVAPDGESYTIARDRTARRDLGQCHGGDGGRR